jgi:hypothetical protein
MIGDQYYHQLDPNADLEGFSSHTAEGPAMRQLMNQFIAFKKEFELNSPNSSLDLPHPLDGITIAGRVNDGEITITKSVILYSRRYAS